MRIEEVLEHYPLGPVTRSEALGGTAGTVFRIEAAGEAYVLRRRGERSSGPDRVAFDARLRRFLQARGLPALAPVRTLAGADGVRALDGFWELCPFVKGRAHRTGDRGQLAALARTLAELHRLGPELRKREGHSPDLPQFTLSVPGTPGSPRIDDPACMLAALDAAAALAAGPERTRVGRMRELVQRVAERYGGPSYEGVDRHVIHGDLHPSNMLFDDRGNVSALFDFDWAVFAPRLRDLADAIWFFAGTSSAGGPDIWALTSARRVDPELARFFLREYDAALPVTPEEARMLPWAWLARWIAIHLEGMYKVPAEDRGRFLTRDMDGPVEEMLSMDFSGLLS
jgi:Ser/Thr protein kinase RdoA (MazF antagonist)